MKIKKPVFLIIFFLGLISCGQNNGNAPSASSCVAGGKCIIFVTQSLQQADMGGIAAADTICTNDQNHPNNGSIYKAMITTYGAGAKRKACSSANCTTSGIAEHVDWVLKPNTQYVRADGTLIATTNSYGTFTFNLKNAVATGTTTRVWTGIDTDWTSSNINNNRAIASKLEPLI